eukprot:1515415-Prymnesium_polylepis.1
MPAGHGALALLAAMLNATSDLSSASSPKISALGGKVRNDIALAEDVRQVEGRRGAQPVA